MATVTSDAIQALQRAIKANREEGRALRAALQRAEMARRTQAEMTLDPDELRARITAETGYQPGALLVTLARASELSSQDGRRRIDVSQISRWVKYGWLRDHRADGKGVSGSYRLVDMFEVELVRRTKMRPIGRPFGSKNSYPRVYSVPRVYKRHPPSS